MSNSAVKIFTFGPSVFFRRTQSITRFIKVVIIWAEKRVTKNQGSSNLPTANHYWPIFSDWQEVEKKGRLESGGKIRKEMH